MHSYGNDSISSRILGWNHGTKSFHTSLAIATAAIFAWAVLISLPLAVGATDKKGNKMMAIKNSPLSKFNSRCTPPPELIFFSCFVCDDLSLY